MKEISWTFGSWFPYASHIVGLSVWEALGRLAEKAWISIGLRMVPLHEAETEKHSIFFGPFLLNLMHILRFTLRRFQATKRRFFSEANTGWCYWIRFFYVWALPWASRSKARPRQIRAKKAVKALCKCVGSKLTQSLCLTPLSDQWCFNFHPYLKF